MPKLIFFLLFKLAFANWNENWMNATEVQWQGTKPRAADQTGIAVYCGFGRSTQRTKVFLTLQNRSASPLCFYPAQTVSLTPNEMKKVDDSLPTTNRGVMHSALRTHLKLKKFADERLRTNFDCRVLNPQDELLPKFTHDKAPGSCNEAKVSLPPDGIFEISYEFYVPYLALGEFSVPVPAACDDSKGSRSKLVFRCVDHR